LALMLADRKELMTAVKTVALKVAERVETKVGCWVERLAVQMAQNWAAL
jgi:hypothetical protein